LTYSDEKAAEEAVNTFDNYAVDNLVCTAKPFKEPGEVMERNRPDLLKKRVYLMNLPYDAYPHEIENLCKEFV
jgi:hypothetical protein